MQRPLVSRRAAVPTPLAARPSTPAPRPSSRRRQTARGSVLPVLASADRGDDSSNVSPALTDQLTLVLYTKADCPLCAGLETKIRAALDKAAFLPSPLTGVPLTIVDIASLPDGGGPLALEVPVVAWRGSGGETRVPRTPPRATAEKVAADLVAARPGVEIE